MPFYAVLVSSDPMFTFNLKMEEHFNAGWQRNNKQLGAALWRFYFFFFCIMKYSSQIESYEMMNNNQPDVLI